MASNQHTELLAAAREVDVEAIERELTQLWKAAAPAEDPSQRPPSDAPPVVRACALNFIVVTGDEKQRDALADMVGDVTLEHPARTFLVAADGGNATSALNAWISARCSLPIPGGKQVCCEQIHLTAYAEEVQKVPSIVTSLLVPDVPSVLWWKSAMDGKDVVLHDLARVVDRVLIDSCDSPAGGTLPAWCRFMNEHEHCTFGDLAWTRLTGWRSVIANAFNPPELRAQLAVLDALTIDYSRKPLQSGLSQALLLAGWFAAKLHWRLVDPLRTAAEGNLGGMFQASGISIQIRLREVGGREAFPGGVEAVTVQSRGGKSIRFEATAFPHCIKYEEKGSSSDRILTHPGDTPEAVLVARELEVVSRDAGYEAVVRNAADLVRSLA